MADEKNLYEQRAEDSGNGQKVKADATTAPTVNNDVTEGYAPNSTWIDITNDKAYKCVDATDGAAVWIEMGGGSSVWQPPTINFGDGYTSGVSVFRSSGSGLLFTFDEASDDEWSANIPLDNNGIEYDGSSLKVRISYQIPVAGGGTDDVKLDFDYAFIKNGDNADLEKTEFTDTLDVSALAGNTVTSYDSSTLTGETGATGLQLSISRNSTGAGADSYANDFDIVFIELIKV